MINANVSLLNKRRRARGNIEQHIGDRGQFAAALSRQCNCLHPKFAGSLEGERARKGVFITTSDFSAEARDYVKKIEKKIVLINGRRLAALMVDFGIGVNTISSYEIVRVDDAKREKWRADLKPVIDGELGKLEKEGIANARAIYDEMRKQVARFAKK